MSIQVQIRGGTTDEHDSFTGMSREITCDTDKKTVVVHDGHTAGGFPLAREDFENLPLSTWEKIRTFIESKQIGMIIAAPLDALDGYLKADGAQLDPALFPALFAAYGTKFGGDGINTFGIPDMRNRVYRGAGSMTAAIGTYQDDAAPNITGQFQAPRLGYFNNSIVSSGCLNNSGQGSNSAAVNEVAGSDGVVLKVDASLSSSAYGRSSTTEIRVKSMIGNFFVKY